ncbi:hypothetical protein [Methylobacterium durans]|uniref:hypothetical protein n=1 Tax=Methylobacterium durans TaxID=2202825 RepID=UPI0013A53F71|nr:hypothetical protein [Methylobacterium durans]
MSVLIKKYISPSEWAALTRRKSFESALRISCLKTGETKTSVQIICATRQDSRQGGRSPGMLKLEQPLDLERPKIGVNASTFVCLSLPPKPCCAPMQ